MNGQNFHGHGQADACFRGASGQRLISRKKTASQRTLGDAAAIALLFHGQGIPAGDTSRKVALACSALERLEGRTTGGEVREPGPARLIPFREGRW